jgi:hypothetical protein
VTTTRHVQLKESGMSPRVKEMNDVDNWIARPCTKVRDRVVHIGQFFL